MAAVEVHNLVRQFKTSSGVFKRKKQIVEAVSDISFSVSKGELFGLLGPNGAGKTTAIKVLTTLLVPDSGWARVSGFDVVRAAREVQKRIGFIFGGERGLYWRLTAEDNLRYFATLYHIEPRIAAKRIRYLVDLVGLAGREKEKVEGYSRGMKQRLHVARTLLHDPDTLFLDEPTIGLDPVGARDFREVILNLRNEGKTILLTTHYMYEADLLSDRIAVIKHGKIVAIGTPSTLKKEVEDLSVIVIELSKSLHSSFLDSLRNIAHISSVTVEEEAMRPRLIVQTTKGPAAVQEVLKVLDGQQIERVEVREPSLEDAYVRLVKS